MKKHYLSILMLSLFLLFVVVFLLVTRGNAVTLPSLNNNAARNLNSITEKEILSTIISDYPELLSSVEKRPDVFDFNTTGFSEISFLHPVRLVTPEHTRNDLTNNEKLYSLHFPMVDKQGNIFAIFSIVKTNEGIHSSINEYFAPMLNKAKNDGIKKVIMQQNKDGLFLIDINSSYQIDSQLIKVDLSPNHQLPDAAISENNYVILNLMKIDMFTTERFNRAGSIKIH